MSLFDFLREPIRYSHSSGGDERPGWWARFLRFLGIGGANVTRPETTPTSQNPRPAAPPEEPSPDEIPESIARNGRPFLELDGKNIRRRWKAHFPEMTPKDVATILRQDMPRGLRMKLAIGNYSPDVLLYAEITSRSDSDYEKFLDLKRAFNTPKKYVYHSFFYMAKRAQGHGVGRIFLANSMELYKKMGIQKIGVQASSDAGAYVWARFGFVPSRDDWFSLRGDLRERLDEFKHKLDPDLVSTIRQVIGSNNPKGIWFISDLRNKVEGKPIGRRLLAGLDWEGSFDLTDADAMARFEAYVRQEPKIAARLDAQKADNAKPPAEIKRPGAAQIRLMT